MISAIVLVCLYSEPTTCQAVISKAFYPTVEICEQDRVRAEEVLGSGIQGVAAYKCIEWGKPA